MPSGTGVYSSFEILAYVYNHAMSECSIFAVIIFSYNVHKLATATCDGDKFTHLAILSHVTRGGMEGWVEMGWD